MCSFTFTLFAITAICSNASASGNAEQQTPQQPQRSSEEDVQSFRRLVQEAPRTIPARRSALLSTQRRGLCDDLLHHIAQWTATPDHLLEAGESISSASPIDILIQKVAFPAHRVGWGYLPLSFEQHQALLKEFKRRITRGTGVLHAELAYPAIKLIIIKDGNATDLDSFELDVVAELKRSNNLHLACDLAMVTRTCYHGVAVRTTIEFKLHFAPPASRATNPPGEVTLMMKLLKDPVGPPFEHTRREGLKSGYSHLA